MRTAVEGSKQIQSENERMGGKLNEIVTYHKNREEVSIGLTLGPKKSILTVQENSIIVDFIKITDLINICFSF